MLVESTILDGQDRLDDRPGDGGQRQPFPYLAGFPAYPADQLRLQMDGKHVLGLLNQRDPGDPLLFEREPDGGRLDVRVRLIVKIDVDGVVRGPVLARRPDVRRDRMVPEPDEALDEPAFTDVEIRFEEEGRAIDEEGLVVFTPREREAHGEIGPVQAQHEETRRQAQGEGQEAAFEPRGDRTHRHHLMVSAYAKAPHEIDLGRGTAPDPTRAPRLAPRDDQSTSLQIIGIPRSLKILTARRSEMSEALPPSFLFRLFRL